jgi:ABC-type transport system involved in multi-copper enzyme maturation permease subunit
MGAESVRKLISLEIKKFKLYSYLRGVLTANLVIMGFLFLVHYSGEKLDSYEMAFLEIGTLVRAIFTIFAAVLISRLFIEEYKNNSIMLMFMYPIKRKKIMIAKIAIVAAFSFFVIFFSNILIGTVFYFVNSYAHILSETLTTEMLYKSLLHMTFEAIASAGISLIPLFFGMRKKSVPATIVSAIILASLTSSTNAGVTAFSYIAIPISLAIIGCLIAYFSIRNVERTDIN